MDSLDRVATALGTTDDRAMEVDHGTHDFPPDASETAIDALCVDYKGENKAPISRRSRRKQNPYKKQGAERKTTVKSKPKYFCEF
jgi:hypothetical protein